MIAFLRICDNDVIKNVHLETVKNGNVSGTMLLLGMPASFVQILC